MEGFIEILSRFMSELWTGSNVTGEECQANGNIISIVLKLFDD